MLLPIIKPLYSNTGRSAKNQQGIIRSLVLMLDQGFHDIRAWAAKVAADKLLCAICGFQFGDAPAFSSYYNLIKRLWLGSQKTQLARKSGYALFIPNLVKSCNRVKSTSYPSITALLKSLPNSQSVTNLPTYRPERLLQKFFARYIVDTSLQFGILGNQQAFSIAADGTPLLFRHQPLFYSYHFFCCKTLSTFHNESSG
jgi:hypothetical protein